jgi:hypothetical protein
MTVYLSICLSVNLSICLSVQLSNCLTVHMSICPSVYLSTYTTDPNLLYFLGQPKVFECSAEGGRPAGTFNWRIGDSNDPKGTLALTNPNPPKVQPAENGYVTVSEV